MKEEEILINVVINGVNLHSTCLIQPMEARPVDELYLKEFETDDEANPSMDMALIIGPVTIKRGQNGRYVHPST